GDGGREKSRSSARHLWTRALRWLFKQERPRAPCYEASWLEAPRADPFRHELESAHGRIAQLEAENERLADEVKALRESRVETAPERDPRPAHRSPETPRCPMCGATSLTPPTRFTDSDSHTNQVVFLLPHAPRTLFGGLQTATFSVTRARVCLECGVVIPLLSAQTLGASPLADGRARREGVANKRKPAPGCTSPKRGSRRPARYVGRLRASVTSR
ncbi:MAG TPA: hypothetical protein VMI75_30185, partial [Polyangiaceae bacterium]|nr:hypothetical protein [Polyangiaceae bacterium]